MTSGTFAINLALSSSKETLWIEVFVSCQVNCSQSEGQILPMPRFCSDIPRWSNESRCVSVSSGRVLLTNADLRPARDKPFWTTSRFLVFRMSWGVRPWAWSGWWPRTSDPGLLSLLFLPCHLTQEGKLSFVRAKHGLKARSTCVLSRQPADRCPRNCQLETPINSEFSFTKEYLPFSKTMPTISLIIIGLNKNDNFGG